ncbi:MAG: DUF4159 domain-containing protein [Acidobacteria bacterium]|nr:DUF4159 domain-containing protein [Acidobacteriota bacterium]
MKRLTVAGVAVAVILAITAGAVFAQWGWRTRYPPRIRPPEQRDAGFSFCRLMYASEYTGRGMGRWSTDYPYADINFMIRLSEMSTTAVNFDPDDEPIHWVVPVTNDALFGCPFIIASAVGSMVLSQDDASRLRDYLLKGGFLWADDFWGRWEWEQWESQIAKVLPPAEYPIVDLPIEHPLFQTMFYIWEVPQIANIGFWRRSGGRTSERGADSAEPHFRVIFDDAGRIMVAMTHNTDIQDAWEREADDPRFFESFAPDGYSLGINVLVYAMTH